MKNVIRLSVVTFLLCMSLQVSAAEGLAVKVSEESIVVEVGNSVKGATLTLKDIHGAILFKDGLMDGKSYNRDLSFEDVPEGIYYLHFEDDFHIYTKKITKSKEGLFIEAKASGIVFKPLFRVDDRKVKFSLPNPEGSHTEVRIYDASGELMLTMVSKDTFVAKTLDFSKVSAGEYEIEVETKNNTFRKVMKLG
ncbi:hypothetical protein [Autumnicola psychrophila]|uniref:Secretion system C-terminal sorting domain-containing protein n=1 Tax=Autumnicola psychrophila TaxID=3075592 RepID=A0ABU3DPH1_9FLAO|nr:hypothetical protein [Zunongwangia sp. F225]MDT0685615.1 hypothetical protein [Zunongwangia sp. F225]